VLAQSKMPDSTQLMLKNMQSRGHPWTGVGSVRLRSDWTNDVKVNVIPEGSTEPVDTLLWVGCASALVDRNVVSNLALVRVLNKAGINFSVLGGAEACCGDPARRVGYEFQYQVMAEQNIEVFNSLKIKQIITTCPHCYNTLKNEYSKFGAVNYKVIHHTELLADLIKQGKLKLNKELNSVLTYHDPCYLGRYNNVYDEPRDVLHAVPGVKLAEMGPSRNLSFCCGGGGGLMWAEEQPGTKKINEKRVEDVIKTKAETVVTACPYCLQMMEESIDRKGVKDSLKAKDLVELVEAAIKTEGEK
jgi:Fe-S oxidoreductase